MPRLAANISTMFGELPLLERPAAAAACGFGAVECQFPYETDAAALAAALAAAGTELVLLNAPAGDMASGDRGLAAMQGREDEFRRGIEQALGYAEATACSMVHVMAGCPTDGGASQRFVDQITWAADQVAPSGITILIEPMSRRDVPGYLLGSSRQAERVIDQVGRDNVRLQYDTYHLQVQEGDLLANFTRCQPIVGHVQISSNPGRHEPDEGEVNHPWFFDQLDSLGYQGWVGCEYRPRGTTLDGLDWATPYGITPRPADHG